MTTREILEKTKAAWPSVRSAGADDKNRLLLSMAEHLMHHADEILFANAQDVEQDLEGLQTMRALGRNMAWLLSCIEAGKDAGINPPAVEPFQRTNFIR